MFVVRAQSTRVHHAAAHPAGDSEARNPRSAPRRPIACVRSTFRTAAARAPRALDEPGVAPEPRARAPTHIYTAGTSSSFGTDLSRRNRTATAARLAVYEASRGWGPRGTLLGRLRRQSIRRGMPLEETVHYGTDYNNAFWNGQQMCSGRGR